MSTSRTELVEAFWRHYRLSQSTSRSERLISEDTYWAWEEVERVAQKPESDALDLLVALADAAPDDQARCYLGAGPLEDFVLQHGTQLIDDIDEAARRNDHFRIALGCVWFGTSVDRSVEERLRRSSGR
jgi:hypothetical protein